jgi:hypothetical protein
MQVQFRFQFSATALLLAATCTPLAAAAGDRAVRHRVEAAHSGAFSPTWAPSLDGSPVEYLIITDQEMIAAFERLADWKTRKGVPAVVRTLDDVRAAAAPGSDLAETIRSYIRDAYRLWGVRFVLLGGDTDVIPVRQIEMQLLDCRRPISELY